MGWRRHYHGYKFMVPTSGAVFGPRKSDAMDLMHSKMRGEYFLDLEAYDLSHVLRNKGDWLGYLYDIGDSWKHIITVLDVVEKGSTLSIQDLGDPHIMEHGLPNNTMTISGNKLWAGAVNCPPEDSTGIDMGRYDEILVEGPSYRPDERGLTWEENGIFRAFDFSQVSHQHRFNAAVRGRKSPKDGNLIFASTPSAGVIGGDPEPLHHSDAWAMRGFLGGQKGRKLKQGHVGGSSNAVEIVGKTKTSNRCAHCGRQPASSAGLKRLYDCSRCRQVAYCGKDCQASDWPTHKKVCKRAKAS